MGVFADFSENDTVLINATDIAIFEEKALQNGYGKYRFCLHTSSDASLHEMIIVTTKDDIKYPDKHLYTTESNIILKGELLVVMFSDEGEIEKTFILSPEKTFYYRCERNKYHLTLPLTDIAVYIEIKEGPFYENTNIFPEWAPAKHRIREVLEFNKEIKNKAMRILTY